MIAIFKWLTVVRGHLKIEDTSLILPDLKESNWSNVNQSFKHHDKGNNQKDGKDSDSEGALLLFDIACDVVDYRTECLVESAFVQLPILHLLLAVFVEKHIVVFHVRVLIIH